MHPGAIAGARAVLALVAALQAEAEPTRAAACPSQEAVWANVAGLVGRERVEAARPALTLEDLGDRYRVVVEGRAHDYADPARDCGKRAQVAAVFVGLTLWPLEVAAPPEPPPPPPPPRTPVALDLAPWLGVAVASGQGGPARAAGARLGVALLGPRLGLVAGAGAELPVGLDLRGVAVDEQRFPIDLGVRLRRTTERVGLAFDLGGVASLVRAAPSSSGGASTIWVDGGARAAATLELFAARSNGRPGYFLTLFADMSPFARSLGLEPDGVVGHASWLRAGAALGVSWKIR